MGSFDHRADHADRADVWRLSHEGDAWEDFPCIGTIGTIGTDPLELPRPAWPQAGARLPERSALRRDLEDHMPIRQQVQGAKCMTRKRLAQSRKGTSPSACISGASSPASQARRRSKGRMALDATRPRCIAYRWATGARCGRLASRTGWRAPLFLCAKHGRGFAALQAMVAGYSACRRVALADWRFAREITR